MARKKMNLQWISNNAIRRATYKRRFRALEKKVGELTTLCGIKACVVVYGEEKVQPEVWPSDVQAKQLLKKFKDVPDVGSFKKVQNHEDFLHSRTVRLHEQVRKLDLENRKYETLVLLHESLDGSRPGLLGTTKEDLISLSEMVESNMNKAKARLQRLVVGLGSLPDPLQVMLPASSSALAPQASSYNYNGMQIPPPIQEHQPQQDWQLASTAPDYGELGPLLCSDFAGTSRGPSGSGCEMMQPYNLGSCSGLP